MGTFSPLTTTLKSVFMGKYSSERPFFFDNNSYGVMPKGGVRCLKRTEDNTRYIFRKKLRSSSLASENFSIAFSYFSLLIILNFSQIKLF